MSRSESQVEHWFRFDRNLSQWNQALISPTQSSLAGILEASYESAEFLASGRLSFLSGYDLCSECASIRENQSFGRHGERDLRSRRRCPALSGACRDPGQISDNSGYLSGREFTERDQPTANTDERKIMDAICPIDVSRLYSSVWRNSPGYTEIVRQRGRLHGSLRSSGKPAEGRLTPVR